MARAIEAEEESAFAVSLFEAARLEPRDMTEFQHDVAVAELQHEAAAAELIEAPRLEVPMLRHKAVVVGLEHETAAAGMTENSRLEAAVLAEGVPPMEL